MKSTLGYKSRIVPAGKALEVFAYGRTFFCQSVSGSITVELDDRGEKLPCFNKQGLKLGPGDYFKRLTFENASASDVTVTFWTGDADIISQGVSAAVVNTGIASINDSWTNNTGSPVLVYASIALAADVDGTNSPVHMTVDGVAIATIENDSPSTMIASLCGVVLPGRQLGFSQDGDHADSTLNSISAFSLA